MNRRNTEYAEESEDGKALVGDPDKAAAMRIDIPNSCDQCTLSVDVRVSDPKVAGTASKMWILGWYQDKNNVVDLLIKPEQDKVLLRRRVNGSIVAKAKATLVIEPQQTYRFNITYDGSAFVVSRGDVYAVYLLDLPATGVTAGSIGFQMKGAYGYVEDIFLYE